MNKEELSYLQKVDPLKKQAEVSAKDRGGDFSPMSPPESHSPPSSVKVNYEDFHPYLRKLVDEHRELQTLMDKFKGTLDQLSQTKEILDTSDKEVRFFFDGFLSMFISHNKEEERNIFPILEKKFLEIGEHSKSSKPITPIDILIDEHLAALQVTAEAKSTWELIQQIFDSTTQRMLLGVFLRKSNTLLEMMKLHIFREDEIVFSLAQRHLNPKELDQLMAAQGD